MSELVTVTIGQSPRTDIQPILEKYINQDIKIIQIGLLDNITESEFEYLTDYKVSDSVYVSRMSDSSEVTLNAEKIETKMMETVHHLDKEKVSQILILCTGQFEDIKSNHSRIYIPETLISPTVSILQKNHQIGIIVPQSGQDEMMKAKWGKYGVYPLIESASPYTNTDEIINAARRLKERGAEYILLDCMGYTEEMKEAVKSYVHVPVILSNALMAKILSELLV